MAIPPQVAWTIAAPPAPRKTYCEATLSAPLSPCASKEALNEMLMDLVRKKQEKYNLLEKEHAQELLAAKDLAKQQLESEKKKGIKLLAAAATVSEDAATTKLALADVTAKASKDAAASKQALADVTAKASKDAAASKQALADLAAKATEEAAVSRQALTDVTAKATEANNRAEVLSSGIADASEAFTCPIKGELFVDPVMASDGFTYERDAIWKWFQKHSTSPMTNEPLTCLRLVTNHNLKQMMSPLRKVRSRRSRSESPPRSPAMVVIS